MADRIYRVAFIAKPIAIHAPDAKQAIEIAIEYLRQPEKTPDGIPRIHVEGAEEQ